MGCGCGKTKTPPAGMAKTSTVEEPPQASTSSVSASTSGATQSFRLTAPSGAQTFYGSRLEAEAARVRSGNVGTIATF